jgi:hypothetical protein
MIGMDTRWLLLAIVVVALALLAFLLAAPALA